MLLASLPADTLSFSIGAVATIVGIAAGYGNLKNKVKTLGDTIQRLEREQVDVDRRLKGLEKWETFTKGQQSVAKPKTRTRNREDDSRD